MGFIFLAHEPLVVAASVTHEVEVVVTESHLNRMATSGYVARLWGSPVFISV